MSLAKAMKDLKFDKRLTEWHLNNNKMTKEEYQKHLDALPDLAQKVEIVNLSGEERSRQEAH